MHAADSNELMPLHHEDDDIVGDYKESELNVVNYNKKGHNL